MSDLQYLTENFGGIMAFFVLIGSLFKYILIIFFLIEGIKFFSRH